MQASTEQLERLPIFQAPVSVAVLSAVLFLAVEAGLLLVVRRRRRPRHGGRHRSSRRPESGAVAAHVAARPAAVPRFARSAPDQYGGFLGRSGQHAAPHKPWPPTTR